MNIYIPNRFQKKLTALLVLPCLISDLSLSLGPPSASIHHDDSSNACFLNQQALANCAGWFLKPWARFSTWLERRQIRSKLLPEDPKFNEDLMAFIESTLRDGYETYTAQFNEITSRAPKRYRDQDFIGAVQDLKKRTTVYPRVVDATAAKLALLVPDQINTASFWDLLEIRYRFRMRKLAEADLARSFYYSLRYRFPKAGPPHREEDASLPPQHTSSYDISKRYPVRGTGLITPKIVEHLIRDHALQIQTPFEDLSRDARCTAGQLNKEIQSILKHDSHLIFLQVLKPVCFHYPEAFIIGQAYTKEASVPFILDLINTDKGVTVEFIFAGEEDVNDILLTSTRSSLFIPTRQYHEVVEFLGGLSKRRGYPMLYAAMGYISLAKQALHQEWQKALTLPDARFVNTKGTPGQSMATFMSPGFPYISKVIRDRPLKSNFPGIDRIMAEYRRVHEIDRFGWMLDTWRFNNYRLKKHPFVMTVLTELLETAGKSVALEGEVVFFSHLYLVRLVEPLDVLSKEVPDAANRHLIAQNYVRAIKEAAATGFFVLGINIKNWGVTHGGRVVLFDYDDLFRYEFKNFHFRITPPPKDELEELLGSDDNPYYSVHIGDVFVDQIFHFSDLPLDFKDVIRTESPELLTIEFWNEAQKRYADGEVIHTLFYPDSKRLQKEPRRESNADLQDRSNRGELLNLPGDQSAQPPKPTPLSLQCAG